MTHKKHSPPFAPILLILALILTLSAAPLTYAQSPPPDSLNASPTASYTFGQGLDFGLMLVNNPVLTTATLHVSTPQFTTTYLAEFPIAADNGATIQLQHTINLAELYIQPFTTVTHWWTLTAADGTLYELPAQTLAYDDNTFPWKIQEEAGIGMYWIADGLDLGQVGMDVVKESLPRILSIIPANMSDGIRIYLYPSADDFQAALSLTQQEWVGGHASPELGVIMLPAENPRTAVVDLRRRIPHELSHLVLYQATGAQYHNVPRWFDEGLGTLFESIPNPNYATALEKALANDTLVPFSQLCTQFPNQSNDEILQAYAQSHSLMTYIQDTYGNQKIQEMIIALADGATCETVTTRTLDRSIDQLTADWLAAVNPNSGLGGLGLSSNLIWLIVIFAGFGLTVLLLMR